MKDFAEALQAFCQKVSPKLRATFITWTQAGKERLPCVRAVRHILSVVETNAVFGFGPYKRKKFAEFLVLAAMAYVPGLHFDQRWLNDLSDIWPIPVNSKESLAYIYPGITNHRKSIVTRLKGLRKHRHFTFPVVVAQLCCWSEQRNCRINWM